MKCFHHPGLEAVGICKVCGKGLCIGCAADLGHALACKGEHEAAVSYGGVSAEAPLEASEPQPPDYGWPPVAR